MRICLLNRRKGNSGNFSAVVLGQLPSRGTIPTSDIHYVVARFDLRFLSHDIHQMSYRDLRAFLTIEPKPVMHVFTPKRSIENI